MVTLTVPRRGGWHAWGAVRAGVEDALADPADPAVAQAEIGSELRRGADSVRVTIEVTADAADVAEALTLAWQAFGDAAADDEAGWDMGAAWADVRPAASQPQIRPARGGAER